MQTWVFNKEDPKPAAADLFAPLHFWFPATLFYLPVFWSLPPLLGPVPPGAMMWALRVAAAAWSLTVGGLVVWIEDRLRPDGSRRIGTWVLAGVTVALLLLRLCALLPPRSEAEPIASKASFVLLSGLVLATWVSVVAGLAAIGVRHLRRKDRD